MALLLRSGTRTIGAIYEWSPSQRRELKRRYEVNLFNRGLPADLVPGSLTESTIKVGRLDLYTDQMESAFGTREIVHLTDQVRPFNVQEVWLAPGGGDQIGPALARDAGASPVIAGLLGASLNAVIVTGAGGGRLYEYRGCWFENIGRSLKTEGSREVRVDATLTWLSRVRVS